MSETILPISTVESEKHIWLRFSRNASISVVGTAVGVVLKLVQTVVLTRFLSIDDYGRFLIVTNIAVFLQTFVGLRVNDAIFRFFQPLKEENDAVAIRRLALVCYSLCVASCLLILLGVFVFADSLAQRVYGDQSLSELFRISAITLLVTSFSGIYEPILRLSDRFSLLVISQVVGSLITLGLLSGYFLTLGRRQYNLRVVVGVIVIGAFVQGLPPLLKSLQLLKPFLADKKVGSLPASFKSKLVQCLVSSNLSGYLKFATSPGDIFLLGVFSSPVDVAWYGIAKQCAAPLAIFEVVMQTAITPEIIFLKAKQRLRQLEQFIARYLLLAGIAGGVMLLLVSIAGRWLFLTVFYEHYSGALPIFYCLVVAAWLLLLLLVFRPLAVTLDLLKWHNLALAISVLVLVLLIASNHLNSFTMAYVQLFEAAILRPAFSLLVWSRLRHQTRELIPS